MASKDSKELEIRDAVYTYLGRRLTTKNKLWHCWLGPDGRRHHLPNSLVPWAKVGQSFKTRETEESIYHTTADNITAPVLTDEEIRAAAVAAIADAARHKAIIAARKDYNSDVELAIELLQQAAGKLSHQGRQALALNLYGRIIKGGK